MVHGVRMAIATALAQHGQLPNADPIDNQHFDCSTAIRGHLLHAWALRAGDPAANVLVWLWEGAPMGINDDQCWEVLDSLWPRRDKPNTIDSSELGRHPKAFVNYPGIDAERELGETLQQYADKRIPQPP